MEEIISKILSLEDSAQQIIADAEEDKKKLEDEFDAKANKLRADIESDEKRRLAEILKEERLKKEKSIEKIEEKLTEQKKMLLRRSESEKGKWVDSIFCKIFS